MGESPVSFLKTLVKYNGSIKLSSIAISFIVLLVCIISSCAEDILIDIRYFFGVNPVYSRNIFISVDIEIWHSLAYSALLNGSSL